MKSLLETVIGAIAKVDQWDYWDAEIYPQSGTVGRMMLGSVSRNRGVCTYTHRCAIAFAAESLAALYAKVYPAIEDLLSKFSSESAICVGGAIASIGEILVGEPSGYGSEDYTGSLSGVKLWIAFEIKSEG